MRIINKVDICFLSVCYIQYLSNYSGTSYSVTVLNYNILIRDICMIIDVVAGSVLQSMYTNTRTPSTLALILLFAKS